MDMLVELASARQELVAKLWNIYFSGEEPYSRKAAWVLDTGSEKNNAWIEPHLETLVSKLSGFTHDAQIRHGLRMISRVRIAEMQKAEVINFCFDQLLSSGTAVAVKFHAMNILYDLSWEYPEIKHELADCIEFQMLEGTPGFKSIGKKILIKLSRQPLQR